MAQSDDDRREASRKRVLKAGKISFGNLHASIDCAVRNLSPGGACLLVDSPVGIPDEFCLLVESDGLLKPCRVKWRSLKRIGVLFSVAMQVVRMALSRPRPRHPTSFGPSGIVQSWSVPPTQSPRRRGRAAKAMSRAIALALL